MKDNFKQVPRMHSKGPTIGITVRPQIVLLAFYERIAERANRLRLRRGERGNISVQQVMLHRLQTLPAYQAYLVSLEQDKK